MKQSILITGVTIALLAMMVLSSSLTVSAEPFKDVDKGSAHYDGINWLYDKGIDGYKDKTFGTYNPLTRAHAAKMFATVLGLETPKASKVEDYFDDVDPDKDDDLPEYVAAVAEEGIFNGKDDNFHPQDQMTREQMATTLVRAYELESDSGQSDKTINLQGVDDSHKKQVQTLANLGVTNQMDNFQPAQKINRGQFATFLYRSDQAGDDKKGEGEGLKETYETKRYNEAFSTMLKKQMAMSTLPQTQGDGSWYDASEDLAAYYANPNNFDKDSKEYYQFMKLSGSSEVDAEELNEKLLDGKGILDGEAKAFKQASKKHNVNEIYLLAHALHETGDGTSELAEGVEVGQNQKGNPVLATASNRDQLKHVKKAYNFFGIKADDANALKNGAKYAYKQGWFSPEKAIMGGAEYIAKEYISEGQDTLYKMRWNPDNPGIHQYATDAGWAAKQTKDIERVANSLQDVDGAVITFEVPKFNNQPGATAKPTGEDVFHLDIEGDHVGEKVKVTEKNLRLREGPTTSFPAVKKLSKGSKVTIIGENADWYKVKTGKADGWVLGDHLKVKDDD